MSAKSIMKCMRCQTRMTPMATSYQTYECSNCGATWDQESGWYFEGSPITELEEEQELYVLLGKRFWLCGTTATKIYPTAYVDRKDARAKCKKLNKSNTSYIYKVEKVKVTTLPSSSTVQ